MKGRSLSILGIFAAVAGALLILCHQTIKVTGVTITGGIIFVAVGLINLLCFTSVSRAESGTGRVLTLIANAAAIVLGISMLVFQSTFRPMIAFMFAMLVGVCALWQFFVLAVGARPHQLPAWLYVFPVLLTAATVYLFIRKPTEGEDHILMLTTGIAFAVLGLGCVIEGSVLGAARRAERHRQLHPAPVGPQPTEAESATTSVTATAPETPRSEKPHIETTDDLDDEIIEKAPRPKIPVETTEDLDDE